VKVLILSAEVWPFAKTGGLGDVSGALPRALARLGVDVRVVLPWYRKIATREPRVEAEVIAERVPCTFAGEDRPFELLEGRLPGPEKVPVWFVRNEWVFEADDDIYGTAAGSYGDGHLRFVYFSEAALRVPGATGFFPDVFHLNDWQSALVAPLLRMSHHGDRRLDSAATVLTIHNLAYQGVFSEADLAHAGVPAGLLEEGRLIEKGSGNLLAGGLRYADAISTVSRTYAREILTSEHGAGLEGLLEWREPLLRGIVNGIDVDKWDPARDDKIAARYDAASLDAKARNRDALLEALDLEPSAGPVFGVVSRLTDQKGLDLLPEAIGPALEEEPAARLVVLGSGDPDLENAFRDLAARLPGRVAAKLAFDDTLAHEIEAGADFFLMPSRFEPCGLNQMISMRYGTPPIVRKTGGLADTVTDAAPGALADGTATGLVFEEDRVPALAQAIRRALALFRKPAAYRAVQRAGMATDVSWDLRAHEYVAMFEDAILRRRGGSPHLAALLPAKLVEPTTPVLPPLAKLPEFYPRDVLIAFPRDPWTLFCAWELGGPASVDRLLRLPEDRRSAATYVIRLVDVHTRQARDLEAGGFARDWFCEVEPERSFEVELLLRLPGEPLRQLLVTGPVTMPPAMRPEGA
jgi:starch synthase